MRQPIFETIKKSIKKKIDDGFYKAGDRIPTEMELANTFDTSRQTVNKALRDLVLDGLIERFPRSGSFVREKVAQSSILDLKNIADEIRERGHTYTNTLVILKKIKANEHIVKHLHVVKDQDIFISQMIHKENDVPVRFDTRYIKPSSAPDYLDQDFHNTTPSQFLKKNCPVEKVENMIEAVMAEEEIQKYLEISKTEPCLKISRKVTSQDTIASFSELYYPSSRYKLNSIFYS